MLRRLVLLGLCCVAVEREAEATTCAPPAGSWYGYDKFRLLGAPVDVRPWILHGCYYQSAEEEFGSCSLVTNGHAVAVSFERDDADCDHEAILYFVPDEPLLPGRRYDLACTEEPYESSWVETRAQGGSASPPEEVVVSSARYVQGDESCCGGDELDLELATEDPAYLREGGRIEVRDEDGHFSVIGEDRVSRIVLAPTLGLELTPVAANGARGPTTRLTSRDIHREPVYIPCAVSRGPSSLALWLLAPLLWIQAHGRRRRRRA